MFSRGVIIFILIFVIKSMEIYSTTIHNWGSSLSVYEILK